MSDEEDSDKEGERAEDAEERIAHELFEGPGGEEGEEDLDEVRSQRRATEKEFEDLGNVEGSEESGGWKLSYTCTVKFLNFGTQNMLHSCVDWQAV